MNRERIISEYRKLGRRSYRQKSGRAILEGYHLLDEALKAKVELEFIIYTDAFQQKEINRKLLARAGNTASLKVSSKLFKAIAQTENPQGVGGIARIPRWEAAFSPGSERFFLILDALQDPGNLGTIIRTAAAAAIDGILLLPGTVDPYNPKALRATQGGIFYLPIMQFDTIESCFEFIRKNGLQLIAAAPEGDRPYYEVDFSRPSAVIIGNESQGVRESLLKKADIRAKIPLKGKISALNAAVAASVFIFEYRRQCPSS